MTAKRKLRSVHPQAQCQGRPGAPWEQVEDLGGEDAAGDGPEEPGGRLPGDAGPAGANKDGVAGPWSEVQGYLQEDRPAERHQQGGGHKEGGCQGRHTRGTLQSPHEFSKILDLFNF